MSPAKGYRIGRHTLLILGMSVIAFNQVYMGFLEYSSLLGYNLYLFAFFILITYLFVGYFNMYVLIPKYLLKGKYATYAALFFLSALLFVVLHYGLEYLVFRIYNVEPGIYSYLKSYGSPFLLEFIASYFVNCIAILGAGILVILKYWFVNDKRKHQLEKAHVQTEVEKLKEQINPQFLFAILHRIGDIVPEDQQKASDLLMELSEILRYQLYDCSREKVLLNAEIQFITSYLRIEKLYYEQMDSNIETKGDMNRISVPPLLFIPLVYYALKDLRESNEYTCMNVCFQSTVDSISFICNCRTKNLLQSADFDKIRQRLESLYQQRYILKVEQDSERRSPLLSLTINQ